jgi:hypothetical protein
LTLIKPRWENDGAVLGVPYGANAPISGPGAARRHL